VTIRHIVTIQVAPGRTADFVAAFAPLQATSSHDPGCQQYELFIGATDPDRVVLLESWASQAALDDHMAMEQARDQSVMAAIIALWAPGTTPTVERFDS
jgi:quinol monooxygenase YgiN